jgi:hypothetical protein
MAVYNDVEGWQNMQFWGSGEFGFTLRNFEVDNTLQIIFCSQLKFIE